MRSAVSTPLCRLLKKELKIPETEEVQLILYPKPKSLWQSLAEGELFKTYLSTSTPSIESRLKNIIHGLETPSPCLLLPEAEIR